MTIISGQMGCTAFLAGVSPNKPQWFVQNLIRAIREKRPLLIFLLRQSDRICWTMKPISQRRSWHLLHWIITLLAEVDI